MLVNKNISVARILGLTWFHIIILLVFSGTIALLYHFKVLTIALPWLPVSVVGTAVAFYVGFKNNQSYDRMWEARKIWGAIVNSSRSWGAESSNFISNHYAIEKLPEEELNTIKKRIIYRHIAWLYALRSQLLVHTEWEHMSQGKKATKTYRFYRRKFGVGLFSDVKTNEHLDKYLPDEEQEPLLSAKNTATQIINAQAKELAELRERGLIDDFRHMELMKVLAEFYDHQGKAERIKKFPLPRQYATVSAWFVAIFIMLLPFSMIPELMIMGDLGIWVSIPLTALIGWIYVMMELVGDYSENPFQGMANDIPMLSLCRTIEIDLLEMLGEKDLPPAIKAKEGILM
ncbi:MAG: bestrophin family ion channel [Crocinitomicaceae bacterium]